MLQCCSVAAMSAAAHIPSSKKGCVRTCDIFFEEDVTRAVYEFVELIHCTHIIFFEEDDVCAAGLQQDCSILLHCLLHYLLCPFLLFSIDLECYVEVFLGVILGVFLRPKERCFNGKSWTSAEHVFRPLFFKFFA